jgi:hypothetical protein
VASRMAWSSYGASAGAAAAGLAGRNISCTPDTRTVSPLYGSVRDASNVPIVQTTSDRCHKHAVSVCLFLVEGSYSLVLSNL